jgi:hypothetical protein
MNGGKMTPNRRVILGFVTLIFIFTATTALADERPIQLSLVTPVQIFPADDEIKGIRLNLLYGRNASVTGLDLGLINHTTSGISTGVQWGFVGLVDSDFLGWQNNTINVVKGEFKGFQWGFVNYAKRADGFQLGFVNFAESMHGLQIGLVNIISQDGAFPVFPIVNWSF